jgi:hypothetical protein
VVARESAECEHKMVCGKRSPPAWASGHTGYAGAQVAQSKLAVTRARAGVQGGAGCTGRAREYRMVCGKRSPPARASGHTGYAGAQVAQSKLAVTRARAGVQGGAGCTGRAREYRGVWEALVACVAGKGKRVGIEVRGHSWACGHKQV